MISSSLYPLLGRGKNSSEMSIQHPTRFNNKLKCNIIATVFRSLSLYYIQCNIIAAQKIRRTVKGTAEILSFAYFLLTPRVIFSPLMFHSLALSPPRE